MADMRIDRGFISTPIDYGEVQENLGIPEDATSLPEWQGWDRIEHSAVSQAAASAGTEFSPELGLVVDQLRSDAEYAGLADLDEKRFLLDVLNNVSGKLDEIIEGNESERLLNFRETLNELLELYQMTYSRQLSNVKG